MSTVRALYDQLKGAVSPAYYARREFGFDPDPWQKNLLDSMNRQIIVNCRRQVGKSTTVGAKAAHQAVSKSSLVVITSPSERQSVELMLKAKIFLQHAGIDIKRETQKSMEFMNGSRMFALPGSEKTVRGFSAVDLLIIDEAARVVEDLYHSVEPMLAVSKGQTLLLSTPWGTPGFFYDIWQHGDEWWERYRVTAYDCPRISNDWIERKRDTTPEWVFRQEYMGEFMESEDAVFREEDIYAAIDGEAPGEKEEWWIDPELKNWEEANEY
mgnify:CR=1 FL=1